MNDTAEWGTPQEIFNKLNEEYCFNLDGCASKDNAKCDKFFDKEQDGLKQDWNGICWMNPPYGKVIGQWVKKPMRKQIRVI